MQKEKALKTEYGYIPTAKESSVLKDIENESKLNRDSKKRGTLNESTKGTKSPSLLGRKLFKLANKNKVKQYEKPIGGKRKFKNAGNVNSFQSRLKSQESFTIDNLNSQSQFGSFLSSKPINGTTSGLQSPHYDTSNKSKNSRINFKKNLFTNQSISTHLASKLSNGLELNLKQEKDEAYGNYDLLISPKNEFLQNRKNLGNARILVKNPKFFQS
jgi:hypothetical protein